MKKTNKPHLPRLLTYLLKCPFHHSPLPSPFSMPGHSAFHSLWTLLTLPDSSSSLLIYQHFSIK